VSQLRGAVQPVTGFLSPGFRRELLLRLANLGRVPGSAHLANERYVQRHLASSETIGSRAAPREVCALSVFARRVKVRTDYGKSLIPGRR